MKVVLVYDRVNKIGGAERVLEVFHEMFPDAPLYTAVYNKVTAPWADSFDVRTTFLQHIPFAKTNHEYLPWLAPLAFETLDFSEFDLVISITSEYAKGIITKPGTTHVCYCLTPTRYLWSGYGEYFKDKVLQELARPVVWYLKTWDRVAGQRPDRYVAISKTIQARVKKYYGRDSDVIYPPVTLNPKQVPDTKYKIPDTKYYLLVSRLVPYKRIDIAIEAANKLGLSLKIVGSGRESAKLKAMAGPTIEFLGNLTDGQVKSYYQNCTALIMPSEEDFGLAVLEAQSFGKPVIAFKGGGGLETIIEGKTGVFFFPQKAEALMKILQNFDPSEFSPKDCQEQAAKFGKEKFKKEFRLMIKKVMEEKL